MYKCYLYTSDAPRILQLLLYTPGTVHRWVKRMCRAAAAKEASSSWTTAVGTLKYL